MRCEIIAVGTELLMGQTTNTNARDIARELLSLGVGVYYQTVVGDNEERLAEVVKRAMERVDLIILSGGLGPTNDDLTRETVARVLGISLEKNEEWEKRLLEFFSRFKRPFAQNNLRQAMVPQGALMLPNDRGTAPGIYLEKGKNIFVLLPGPPKEMLPILKEQVIPLLKQKLKASGKLSVLQSRVLHVIGLGESNLVEMLKGILDNQDNPTIAPLAKGAEVHLRLTARGHFPGEAQALLSQKAAEIKAILGDYVYGEDTDTLELAVARQLKAAGKTLALAESCTGGLLTHRLTNIPGSSEFLLSGLVTYSNEAKITLLGVDPAVISAKGAVSAETAAEMAAGARRATGADISLGITGIAGPGGETPQKPVGLTYISLEAENFSLTRKYQFWGSRVEIKERATQTALYLLRRFLLNKLSAS
ncbi:MAG: competence/damage-inducible protein A [Firmicutes bacterium]|mgnify:CR=1 FL=1|nr:competence/damage-inducible protein A [Bacillota bacterium]